MFVIQPYHGDADDNGSSDCSDNVLHNLAFPESKDFSGCERRNVYVVYHAALATLMVDSGVLEYEVFGEWFNLNHRGGEHLCSAAATLHKYFLSEERGSLPLIIPPSLHTKRKYSHPQRPWVALK